MKNELPRTYGLRHKKEGWLMTVSESSNNGAVYCNPTTVYFDGKDGDRPYEVENRNDAIASLVLDTPWYASSGRRPQTSTKKGKHYPNPQEFEVVQITRQAYVEDVEFYFTLRNRVTNS